jgi:hypothetical protein
MRYANNGPVRGVGRLLLFLHAIGTSLGMYAMDGQEDIGLRWVHVYSS